MSPESDDMWREAREASEARQPGPEAQVEGQPCLRWRDKLKHFMYRVRLEKKTSIMFQQLNRDLRAQGCKMCFKH